MVQSGRTKSERTKDVIEKKRDRELEKEAERFVPEQSIAYSAIINENNKLAMTHVT
jgi:hypothetical protein